MAKPEKVAAVAKLVQNFEDSQAAVLTEYRGLTVAAMKELRRSLGDVNEYSVVKNTLATIAVKQLNIEAFNGQLKGPNAIVFVKGDTVSAAKSLVDFAKVHTNLVIKAGVFEGNTLDAAAIADLAALESRDFQLSKVAAVLQAPMSKLVRTVDALREKLETENGVSEVVAPVVEQSAE